MNAQEEIVDVNEGYIHFIGQGVEVESQADSNVHVYRAYAE